VIQPCQGLYLGSFACGGGQTRDAERCASTLLAKIAFLDFYVIFTLTRHFLPRTLD